MIENIEINSKEKLESREVKFGPVTIKNPDKVKRGDISDIYEIDEADGGRTHIEVLRPENGDIPGIRGRFGGSAETPDDIVTDDGGHIGILRGSDATPLPRNEEEED